MDQPEPLPPQRETLQSGPTRTPPLDRLTPEWRRRGVVLTAFAFGVISGGGALWWWNDRPPEVPAPSPPAAAAGTDVRLLLIGVVAPPRWTPSAQPFTLTWKDDHGDVHVDVGGDHDASTELTLIHHLDAVCGIPGTR